MDQSDPSNSLETCPFQSNQAYANHTTINSQSIFDSPFKRSMIQHEHIVSLRPVIKPIFLAFGLLFLSALSLPYRNHWAIGFRSILVIPLLIIAYDILLNRNYSWGSAFRDSAFPSVAFLIVYRALDFAFLNLWDQSTAFDWIVPDHRPISEKGEGDDQKLIDKKDQSKVLTVGGSGEECFNKVPTRWKRVAPPPLLSIDRLIWTIDNLTLLRPGSSWILPWKVRALEWSRRALETNEFRFGEPEWPILPAIAQQIVHLGCHSYIRRLNLQANQTLWDQPLHVQCGLTFALGGIVTFGSALEEAITYPILIRFKILPRTALTSNAKRAITSTGLVDLWGKRWHHFWRRPMARLARLFPGASRNRLVHAFATFWVSAAMHCLLIARLYPAPTISQPRSFIPLFYEPGIYTFFLFQGLGTIIERIFLPIRAKESRLRKTLRLLWCYFVLIGSGRYATNTMVVNGLMAKKEWDMLNWTVVIKMIFGLFKFW